MPAQLVTVDARQFSRELAKQLAIYVRPGTPARYKYGDPGTGASKPPEHRVGETKVFNGKTYRLNERHRWELADKEQAGDHRQAGGQQPEGPAPLPSHEELHAASEKHLDTVHQPVGDVMKAFRALPGYQEEGTVRGARVRDDAAQSIHAWMSQNVGKRAGGGIIIDMGDGYMGMATPAGAVVIGRGTEDGQWRASYTNQTRMVADQAVQKTETSPPSEKTPGKPVESARPKNAPISQTSPKAPPPLPPGAAQKLPNNSAHNPTPQPENQTNQSGKQGPNPAQQTAQQTAQQMPGNSAQPPRSETARQEFNTLDARRFRDTAAKLKQRMGEAAVAHDDAIRAGDLNGAKLHSKRLAALRSAHRESERIAGEIEQAAKGPPQAQPGQPTPEEIHGKIRGEFPHADPEHFDNLANLSDDDLRSAAKAMGVKSGIGRSASRENLLRTVAKSMFGPRQQPKPTTASPASDLIKGKRPKASPEEIQRIQAEDRAKDIEAGRQATEAAAPLPVPNIVTFEMERELASHGFTPEQIKAMKPEEARQKIAERTPQQQPAAPAAKPAQPAQPRTVAPAPVAATAAKPLTEYSPETQQRAATVLGPKGAGSWLARHRLSMSPKNIDALHAAIDEGYINQPAQLEKVLAQAEKIHSKGNLREDDSPAVAEALRRRRERFIKSNEVDPFEKAAEENQVDPDELRDTVEELAVGERQQQAEREAVKKAIRSKLGLTAADIARIENTGGDYSQIEGFDEKVRSLAGEFPEYLGGAASFEGQASGAGTKATESASEKVWQMLREGTRPMAAKHKFIPRALEILLSPGMSDQERAAMESIPFKRRDQPAQYKAATTPIEIRNAVRIAAMQTNRTPTKEQRESGNYRKGKCRIHGLEIAIENPRGSIRSGESKDGHKWRIKMPWHYGYIKQTESEADGDHFDCFIGPQPEIDQVFVIDQLTTDGHRFDESKAMIGFANERDAKEAYLAAYQPGWKGFSAITPLSMAKFKRWLETGNTAGPIARQVGTVV